MQSRRTIAGTPSRVRPSSVSGPADYPRISVKAKPLRSTVELVLTVAAALFFALTIQAFAVKPYKIPSGSMLPTLEPGQRILVNRFSHHVGSDPKVGDVTVFLP